MSLCPYCYNRRVVYRDGVPVPCDKCLGQEPSCCDGPVGERDEEPTDPNA